MRGGHLEGSVPVRVVPAPQLAPGRTTSDVVAEGHPVRLEVVAEVPRPVVLTDVGQIVDAADVGGTAAVVAAAGTLIVGLFLTRGVGGRR